MDAIKRCSSKQQREAFWQWHKAQTAISNQSKPKNSAMSDSLEVESSSQSLSLPVEESTTKVPQKLLPLLVHKFQHNEEDEELQL